MKTFLIKSSQPNGHYCAQRHFGFAGDAVTEDTLTNEQWAEVRNDAWLTVVGIGADAQTVGELADEMAKAETAEPEIDKQATGQEAAAKAAADKLAAKQAADKLAAQKAKAK